MSILFNMAQSAFTSRDPIVIKKTLSEFLRQFPVNTAKDWVNNADVSATFFSLTDVLSSVDPQAAQEFAYTVQTGASAEGQLRIHAIRKGITYISKFLGSEPKKAGYCLLHTINALVDGKSKDALLPNVGTKLATIIDAIAQKDEIDAASFAYEVMRGAHADPLYKIAITKAIALLEKNKNDQPERVNQVTCNILRFSSNDYRYVPKLINILQDCAELLLPTNPQDACRTARGTYGMKTMATDNRAERIILASLAEIAKSDSRLAADWAHSLGDNIVATDKKNAFGHQLLELETAYRSQIPPPISRGELKQLGELARQAMTLPATAG